MAGLPWLAGSVLRTAEYLGAMYLIAVVDSDRQRCRFADLPLERSNVYEGVNEWVVPVRGIMHKPCDKARRMTGLFANQNSALKLSNRFTLGQFTAELGLDDQAA